MEDNNVLGCSVTWQRNMTWMCVCVFVNVCMLQPDDKTGDVGTERPDLAAEVYQ